MRQEIDRARSTQRRVVPPEQRPPPRVKAEVVQGPGYKERPRKESTFQAVSALYRVPGCGVVRQAFVARTQDGVVWCSVLLLPGDDALKLPEDVERENPLGQTVIRRGSWLAVRGAVQGTKPGQYQPA